ncbi:ligand-gated channel [Allostella vacuolata]|nr:ligand-gated channel [Stella vacuolata]
MGAVVRVPGGSRRSAWCGAVWMTTALAAAWPGGAMAQQGPGAQPAQAQAARYSFDIPPQSLTDALARFGRQSGMQVSVDAALIRAIASPGASGSMTAEQALARLLAGTGMTYRLTGDNTAMLQRLPPGASEGATIALDAVRVAGVAGGFHPEQTEGTGAYTASAVTIGKTPTSLRQTPHSVSVVTRQRMDDQNMTELGDALRAATGVTVASQSGIYAAYLASARGYNTGIQLDGLNQEANFGNAQLDLAVYDRVEVLRGPAGLFTGAGSAGVTSNLVRKRALGIPQIIGQLRAGSWDSYRGEADITGPLTESGNVRARLVTAVEQRGDWLNNTDNDKKLFYNTVEVDIGERGTLSVGGAWQRADASYSAGLPAFADGRLLDVARSTSLVADWNEGILRNSDVFAEYEHRFDNGGLFKAVARHAEASRDVKYLSVISAPAVDGTTPLRAFAQDLDQKTTSADMFFSTPFELGGMTHNILLGADYRRSRTAFATRRTAQVATVNIFSFDPATIAEPDFAAAPVIASSRTTTETYGTYGQLRVKPVDFLTLIAGGRLSWYESKPYDRLAGEAGSGGKESAQFTPYAAAVVDVTPSLSLYASYAEIFEPQSVLDVAGDVLSPRIGSQVEVGVKGEWFDGRLNASAALYRITDRNNAVDDPDNDGFSIAAGKVRAQGAEVEIGGALTEHWRVTSGYAYTETRHLAGNVSQSGQPFSTTTPRHDFKLWTHYRLPDSLVPGLEVGAGVRAVSGFYNQTGAIRRQADAYAIASLRLGYRINDHLQASLNFENLFDAKYYERVGGATSLNTYGAPRSVVVGLRGTF